MKKILLALIAVICASASAGAAEYNFKNAAGAPPAVLSSDKAGTQALMYEPGFKTIEELQAAEPGILNEFARMNIPVTDVWVQDGTGHGFSRLHITYTYTPGGYRADSVLFKNTPAREITFKLLGLGMVAIRRSDLDGGGSLVEYFRNDSKGMAIKTETISNDANAYTGATMRFWVETTKLNYEAKGYTVLESYMVPCENGSMYEAGVTYKPLH